MILERDGVFMYSYSDTMHNISFYFNDTTDIAIPTPFTEILTQIWTFIAVVIIENPN